MKKAIAIIIAVILVLSLCACGNSSSSSKSDKPKSLAGSWKMTDFELSDQLTRSKNDTLKSAECEFELKSDGTFSGTEVMVFIEDGIEHTGKLEVQGKYTENGSSVTLTGESASGTMDGNKTSASPDTLKGKKTDENTIVFDDCGDADFKKMTFVRK